MAKAVNVLRHWNWKEFFRPFSYFYINLYELKWSKLPKVCNLRSSWLLHKIEKATTATTDSTGRWRAELYFRRHCRWFFLHMALYCTKKCCQPLWQCPRWQTTHLFFLSCLGLKTQHVHLLIRRGGSASQAHDMHLYWSIISMFCFLSYFQWWPPFC